MNLGSHKRYHSSEIGFQSIHSSATVGKVREAIFVINITNHFLIPDDTFLLQFLRTKKYSMDQAFQVLENHIMFRRNHFEWFDLSDEKIKVMKELCSSGYMYPLVERDAEGQKIILVNHYKMDIKKFKSDDAFHLFYAILFTLLQEEETQISGIRFIMNYEEVTVNYVSKFPVVDLADFVRFLKNSCPYRVKEMYHVNLPTFANYLMTMAKAGLTDKLRDRLILVESMDEVTRFVDKSLLPRELGGEKFTETETIARFMENFNKNLNILKLTNEFEIDVAKLHHSELQANVGSFRKLEID